MSWQLINVKVFLFCIGPPIAARNTFVKVVYAFNSFVND